MRLWRNKGRRKAIAIAIACAEKAGIGVPQLIDAEHLTSADYIARTLEHLRSRGSSDWVVNTMRDHLALQPPPTGWRVSFWVRDSRYASGSGLVIVTVDDSSGLPQIPVRRTVL